MSGAGDISVVKMMKMLKKLKMLKLLETVMMVTVCLCVGERRGEETD